MTGHRLGGVIELLDEPSDQPNSGCIEVNAVADGFSNTGGGGGGGAAGGVVGGGGGETKKKRSTKTPRFIPLELQKLFTYMQRLDMKALSTQDLTKKGFQWEVRRPKHHVTA